MVPYAIYSRDFVRHTLNLPRVRKIIEDWPIENEQLERIILDHLYNIGIYHVPPVRGAKLIQTEVVYILKNSIEIKRLILKAQKAAVANRKDKAGRI